MTKISTYHELVAERKMIEATIVAQKAIISNEMSELKTKLEPFLYLLPVLNIFKSKAAGTSMLSFVASKGIDLMVGKNGLMKSNWLVRLIAPLLLNQLAARQSQPEDDARE
ncbi:MAG: hypothetical protein ACK5RG_13480 [Cyclobacteriaceae bacterium]|jgi:hypothetical protein